MADSDSSRRDPAGAGPARPAPGRYARLVRLGRGGRVALAADADAAALAVWRASPLAAEPDSFVLYRILGNDLEPRHRRGQARDNLAFLLAHEPPLEGCEKRWVVNRIADPEQEVAILALLAAHEQPVLHLPFVPEDYARAGWDTAALPDSGLLAGPAWDRLDPEARKRLRLALYRTKNAYAMNNNGARNAALEDGRGRAKWILPWDGNCFVTTAAWAAIRAAVAARPHLPYFLVPMARVPDNAALLDPGFAPEPSEEPQILMRCDAREAFDPAFVYGRRPKVELFWRLGVSGAWDHWRDDLWDPPRRPRAPEAGQVGTAGWVARLASGRAALENGVASFQDRGAARRQAIVATLDALDARLENPAADPGGMFCYDSRALAALADTVAGAPGPLATRILADAEAALGRGPYSVVDKTTLPPSRNPHDYWHPAPYWWPNRWVPGGLPYVQRDGERVPGTRMYEPDSERYDRTRLQRLFDDTTALALAWRLTGRKDFAAHAAGNVAAWFAAPATRMTPHLRYAQVRRGRNRSQGTGTGIIEFKDLYYFLDAVRLLEAGAALGPDTAVALRAWLTEYLGWLLASPQGARERTSANNHGTYYDLQVAAVAAWLGERDTLREALVRAQSRLHRQIAATGEQPEELARTTTAHYCLFNLQGWMGLVRIGRRCGVLRPDFAAEPWARLARAVAWVLDHDLARWPYPQIDAFDPARGLPLAAQALANGIADLGRNTAELAARHFAADPPVFAPHDGIVPYWALAAAAPGTPAP